MSQTGRLTFSTISPLFVDRFKRSLRFGHLQFDQEAISRGFMSHSRVFRVSFILSDFRELSFCGPCGPCYLKNDVGRFSPKLQSDPLEGGRSLGLDNLANLSGSSKCNLHSGNKDVIITR